MSELLMCAGGMSGVLLPAAGEPCPAVLPAPFSLGEDVNGNAVCCASFANPPDQEHIARPLPGQIPPVRPVASVWLLMCDVLHVPESSSLILLDAWLLQMDLCCLLFSVCRWPQLPRLPLSW